MDTTIELRDPEVFPDEGVLKTLFGRGYPAYLALLEILDARGIGHEWIYYRDYKAWLCKAARKKKTAAWMSARKGFLAATIYFPAAHIDALYGLGISEEAKARIRATENTGKSKGVTFEVRGKAVLEDFEAVLDYRLSIK